MSVERLYNSVEFDEPVELQAVELKIGRSYRRGRESHISPKGPLGPDELRSGEDADKMP